MVFLKDLFKKVLFCLAICFTVLFISRPVFSETDINAQYILNVIMDYPPFWHQDRDETKEERLIRFKPLSVAIYKAARKHRPAGIDVHTMESALTSLAFKESVLARNIANGNCKDMPKGMRCDMKNGKPRARTYFQLWEVACPEVHSEDLEPGSQEELEIAAECAAKSLSYAYRYCGPKNRHNYWAGAYSGYAGYKADPCNWPGAINRAKHMKYIENKIRIEKYKQEKNTK